MPLDRSGLGAELLRTKSATNQPQRSSTATVIMELDFRNSSAYETRYLDF